MEEEASTDKSQLDRSCFWSFSFYVFRWRYNCRLHARDSWAVWHVVSTHPTMRFVAHRSGHVIPFSFHRYGLWVTLFFTCLSSATRVRTEPRMKGQHVSKAAIRVRSAHPYYSHLFAVWTVSLCELPLRSWFGFGLQSWGATSNSKLTLAGDSLYVMYTCMCDVYARARTRVCVCVCTSCMCMLYIWIDLRQFFYMYMQHESVGAAFIERRLFPTNSLGMVVYRCERYPTIRVKTWKNMRYRF